MYNHNPDINPPKLGAFLFSLNFRKKPLCSYSLYSFSVLQYYICLIHLLHLDLSSLGIGVDSVQPF